jgi:hypothetical protein
MCHPGGRASGAKAQEEKNPWLRLGVFLCDGLIAAGHGSALESREDV